MQLPLDIYIAILRSASETDGPFNDHPKSEIINPAFAALAHAAADFVDTFNDNVEGGYEIARSTLEDLVHTFPIPETQIDPLMELRLALAESLGVPLDAEEQAAKAAKEGNNVPVTPTEDDSDAEFRRLIESAFGSDYNPDAPLGDDADGPVKA